MLYLGNVFFTLGADTRGLSSAANRLRDFGRDIDKVSRYAMDGAAQITSALSRQERAAISALDRVKAFQAQIARTAIPESTKRALAQDATALFDTLSRQLTAGKLNPLDQVAFTRTLGSFQSGLNDLKRNLREVQDASRAPPTRTWEAFRNNIRSVGHAALFTQGHLGGMSTRMFALSSLIDDFGIRTAVIAGTLAGFSAAVGILGTSMVNTAKKLQAIEKAFDAVSGSAAMTAYHFQFVQKVADQAGLVFTDISKSYTRFLAAGQAANLGLNTIQESFHGVALAAGILQLSVEDTQGVFKALEQILSKGTVQSEELRGQLGDRFPTAFAIAAKAIGKTTAELSDMLKKGQVVSTDFVPKFVEAMKKVYNIDISKNVETIQGEQNRLTNEWVNAVKALDDLLGVSTAWQNVLMGLKNVLIDFRQNIAEVASVATGLAAGIAAFWAVAYLPAAYAAVLAFFSGLYRFILLVDTAVRLLTVSQILMNAAMLANPAMALISLLGRLAVALTAGVGAYKLMQGALKDVHDEMARGANQEVDAYIAQQKNLLSATSAATNEFIKQQQVFAAQKMFEYIDAAKEAADTQKELADTTKDLQDVRSRPGRANMELAAGLGAQAAAQKKQVTEAQKAQQALGIEATKAQTRILELQKLYNQQVKLEEDMANAPSAGDKGSKDKSDGLARIRDIIAAAQEARDVVQSIGEGGDPRFVRDLYDAKDALRELDSEERAGAAALLGVANNAGLVETKLASMITIARKGKEEFSDFMRIWENIEDDSRELENMKKQLDYLLEGGDPRGLLDIQYLGEAQSILKNLSATSLEAIRQKLASIGIYGDTAAAALSGFFAQQKKADELVATLADLNDEVRDTKDSISDMAYIMEALNNSFMNGDAANEFIDRVKKLREYARDLAAGGMNQDQIRTVLASLDEQLRKQQDMQWALDNTAKAAERVKQGFQDMVTESLTGLREVIKGTKSLGDALMDLAYNVIDNLWESVIMGPAQDALAGLFRKQGQQTQGSATDTAVGQVDSFTAALAMASEATKGSFVGSMLSAVSAAATESLASNVVTQTKSQETLAIISATTALTALTTAAWSASAALAGDEGGGGGGWLSKLFKIGSQLAMAIGSEGSAAAGTGAEISDGTGMNSPSPRRHGGPMLAGTMYSINEPGVNGEYFIPAMNGYMSPDGGGGGGNSIYVDASTRIDARGATRETIAELRREMDARDSQMRQELPYLIDGRITQSSGRGRI